MKRALMSVDFRSMSQQLQNRRVDELIDSTRTPPNGEVMALDREIAVFEQEHGFSSENLRQRVERGDLSETFEICRWLMLIELRDQLGESGTRAG